MNENITLSARIFNVKKNTTLLAHVSNKQKQKKDFRVLYTLAGNFILQVSRERDRESWHLAEVRASVVHARRF